MKKKLLAGLLTICMTLSLVPTTAYAQPTETAESRLMVPVSEGEIEKPITEEEAGAYHQIQKEIPLIQQEVMEGVPATYSSAPPSRYDGRSILPGARDQGGYGTCWSFASMAAAEGGLLANGKQVAGSAANTSLDLSEYQLAYFHYNSTPDSLQNTVGDATIGQDIWGAEYDGDAAGGDLTGAEELDFSYLQLGGNLMFATWTMAGWQSGAEETVAPYSSISKAGLGKEIAEKNKVHLENAYWISMEQPEIVKKMIMNYGAVGSSYLHSEGGYHDGTCAYYSGNLSGYGHAIAIVGWDDNFSREKFNGSRRPSRNGAWLVRNSWGGYWGENGYFWMSYEEPTLDGLAMVFDFADAGNYDYNYQYDGSCGTASIAFRSGEGVGNVFTVKGTGTQILEAVALGVDGVNTKYSLQIYKNPKAGAPTSGTPMLPVPQTGTLTFTGYHTIPLETPVALQQGDTFAVVFTLLNPARIFVDYTYANANWIRFVSTTRSNQSYGIFADGSADDLHKMRAAARVKAFTNVAGAGTKVELIKAQPGKDGRYTYYKNGAAAISETIYAPKKVELSYTNGICTGEIERPDVTAVYDRAGNIISPSNYTVSYSKAASKAPGSYTVTVNFTGACYSGSLSQKYTLKISPVTKLKTAATSTDSVELRWKESKGVSGYYVYMAESAKDSYRKVVTLTGSATTSCIIDELAAGRSYYFKVQPYVGSYKGTASGILYSATRPVRVSGLKVTAQGSGYAKLFWKAVKGASGYEIQRYDNSSRKWSTKKSVDKGTTVYKDTKLKAGLTYQYRVRAYRKNKDFTANGKCSATVSVHMKPAQVKSLKNSSSTTTSVKISWPKVTGASGYQIYHYDTAAKKWKKLAAVSGSRNYYTQKKLKAATTYKYKVRAYRRAGGKTLYGSFSKEFVTSTSPKKVQNVRVSGIGKASLKLNWSKVTGASGYQIYQYSSAKKKFVRVATVTKGKILAKKFTKLKRKTTYQFKVRAYRKVSGTTYFGSFSNVKKVRTRS